MCLILCQRVRSLKRNIVLPKNLEMFKLKVIKCSVCSVTFTFITFITFITFVTFITVNVWNNSLCKSIVLTILFPQWQTVILKDKWQLIDNTHISALSLCVIVLCSLKQPKVIHTLRAVWLTNSCLMVVFYRLMNCNWQILMSPRCALSHPLTARRLYK